LAFLSAHFYRNVTISSYELLEKSRFVSNAIRVFRDFYLQQWEKMQFLLWINEYPSLDG